jgi:hypothetical protein
MLCYGNHSSIVIFWVKFLLYSEEYLEFFEVLEKYYLFHDFCSEHQMVLTKFIHPNLLEIYSVLAVALTYTPANGC